MFLPDNYEAPKSSNGYMKLQEGENRIRILSQPILGWEDWTLDKKPVRFKYDNKPLKSIDPKKPVRHFWAFVVWNYNEEQIQILQVSQATIRKSLENLCKDADWGAPYFYDIKITKEGEGVNTEYGVNPASPKPTSQHIIDAFNEKPCYLEALFDNQDPFAREWHTHTPGVFSKEDIVGEVNKGCIKKEQADELQLLLDQCDPKYKESVWDMLHKHKVSSLIELPLDLYERLKNAATRKMEEFKKLNREAVDFILQEV